MARPARSFRIGKVQAYLRGQVWYLCYHDNGRRHRPRVGTDRHAAKQLAAQINAQLAVGAPAAFSFEPISIPELRRRWLEHHEHVLRSSIRTVQRYRTATDHLLRFVEQNPVKHVSQFHARHAEEFIRFLRSTHVSPNGHANTAKRPLMDKGVRFILECCRSLFNYAAKRRHLCPYAENPYRTIEVDRIPIEHTRPVTLFTAEQELAFLQACDDWQFPLFLTLMLTGLRSGELCHLLLPEDLDLRDGMLHVRNKPSLGWQVKTRNEREIPLHSILTDVLRIHLAGRTWGPLFQRRQFAVPGEPQTLLPNLSAWEQELKRREHAHGIAPAPGRAERQRLARALWREQGFVEEDWVRVEFMRLTRRIDVPGCTSPKMLRHLFATGLQEGRVDPLIRNELMGHVAEGMHTSGHGLAMTAVYTHTRPEIRQRQLMEALSGRPAIVAAKDWLRRKQPAVDSSGSGRR
jgi:integrase